MHISVYLGGTGKNSDIGVWFLDPDFLVNGEISAIWERFQLIFHRTRNTFCGTYICLMATAQRPNCSYNKVILRILLRMRETAIFPLSIWVRFQLIFFIGKANSPPYFYFRFTWFTDLESVPRVEPPTLIISTKFEVDTSIHRRVKRCWCGYVTWPCNVM